MAFRKIALAAACMSLFAAGNAQAVTLVSGTPLTHSWRRWANQSQMPTPNVAVSFTEFTGVGPCGGNPGCTTIATIAITRRGDLATLRHYLWHEMTHVFDAAVMNNYYRAQFMAAWGLRGGPYRWWTPLPSTDGGSAGEWFAEAGALCSKYGLNVGRLPASALLFDWTLDGFPGRDNMAALARSCQTIVAAGQAAGLPVPMQRTYGQTVPSRRT